jgi:hypothetical protein
MLFALRGEALDGTRIAADDLIINTWRYKWEREGEHSFAPSARVQRCTFTRDAEPSAPVLRLFLKGFRCFPQCFADHRLGRVVLSGATEIDDPDTLTGAIAIAAPTTIDDAAAWRENAEALLQHLRRIMSFASGVTLRGPVTEFYNDAKLVVTCGSQARQERAAMPVAHYLDMQPMFEAALKSFDGGRIAPRDLLVALEWFTMSSTYNEVRLVNTMTALENLVDTLLTPAEKRIVGTSKFVNVAKALRETIAENAAALTGEDVAAMQGKLAELNRRALKAKLELLFRRFDVPLTGIGEEALARVIKARNNVVHRGFHDDSAAVGASGDEDDDHRDNEGSAGAQDLWDDFTIARDLLIRVVASALDYRGQYASFIGGYHLTAFPPPA